MEPKKILARLDQQKARNQAQSFEITEDHELRVESVTQAKRESFTVPLRLISPNPARLQKSNARLIRLAWFCGIGSVCLIIGGGVGSSSTENSGLSVGAVFLGLFGVGTAFRFAYIIPSRAVDVLSFTAATGARLPLWFNNPTRAEFEKFVEQLKTSIEVAQKAQPLGISLSAELVRIKELFDQGTLDKEQFEAAKNRLVGNEPNRRVGF